MERALHYIYKLQKISEIKASSQTATRRCSKTTSGRKHEEKEHQPFLPCWILKENSTSCSHRRGGECYFSLNFPHFQHKEGMSCFSLLFEFVFGEFFPEVGGGKSSRDKAQREEPVRTPRQGWGKGDIGWKLLVLNRFYTKKKFLQCIILPTLRCC